MRVPKLARRVTDPLISRVPVPVLSGVNRGLWWSLVSAGSGYASGRRADAQLRLLAALLRPGDVMWDVGAHHGYVTLCAARRVGPAGVVHAFEPSGRNRTLLERHVAWNGLRNVHVQPYALSAHDGEACFGGTGTSKMLALGGGSERVAVRTAATLVAQGICPVPAFLKVDVEGVEADTLAGLLAVLPRDARLLIAMHTREADARCTAQLERAGFSLFPSAGLRRCRSGEWVGDPDLFCAGPEWSVSEDDAALLRSGTF